MIPPKHIEITDPAYAGQKLNRLIPADLVVAITNTGLLDIGKDRIVPKEIIIGPGCLGVSDDEFHAFLIKVAVRASRISTCISTEGGCTFSGRPRFGITANVGRLRFSCRGCC